MERHDFNMIAFNNISSENDSIVFGNFSPVNAFVNPFNNTLTRIFFIICYGAVFAMCVIGNTMVLFAIASSPRLRSMTNFFLANLAVADFCVGVFCVLPNLSTFLSQKWILGRVMCKIYYYVWNLSYTASIVILTVIAVERYIVIIYPLKAKYFRRRKKMVITCLIIWTIAVVYNIPYLFFYDTISIATLNLEFCYFNQYSLSGLRGLSLANFIVWFIIPLALIGVMYIKVGFTLYKAPIGSTVGLRSNSSQAGSQRSLPVSEDSQVFSDSAPGHNQNFTESNEMAEESCSDYVVHNSDNSKLQSSAIQHFASHRTRKKKHVSSPKARVLSINKTRELCSGKVNMGRRKVIRLLVAVVVSFGVCVLPHHLKVLNHFWNIVSLPHSVDVYFSPISFIVLYLNSCLNPILYALFSTNFRMAFSETVICLRSRNIVKRKATFFNSTIRK